jgi:hypothetical protein
MEEKSSTKSGHRWGTRLVAIGFSISGIVLLLFNFGVLARFEPAAQYLLATVAILGGCGFFLSYASSRQEWWRLIPGWTLLALAGMILLSTIPALSPQLPSALLFVGLSLAFVHIYLLNRQEFWWAVIPGGFMLVLGCIMALSGYVHRLETLGALLFVGMGLVFFVLYGLEGRRRQWWSLIPGSILVVFGFFVFSFEQFSAENGSAPLRWWPLLLIALGLFLGFRSGRRQRAEPEKLVVNTAPSSTRRTGENKSRPGLNIVRALRPQARQGTPNQRLQKPSTPGNLGEYTHPAPGTSIEVLPDPEQ